MNERFGTDFTHADKIINEMEKHMRENQDVKEAAENNTYNNYRYSFSTRLRDFIVDNIEVKEEYIKLLERPEALTFLEDYLSKKIYAELAL